MKWWPTLARKARKCLSCNGKLGITTSQVLRVEGTPQVKRNPIPNVVLDPVRESLVSSSGALLMRESIRLAGLDRGLSRALVPWRSARAVHDPGKVLLDVATAVALGGCRLPA